MITILRAAAPRATLAAILLHLLPPGTAVAEGAPYWLVPGAGVAWLPNELLVKPSRPQVGGIIGARISPNWAAEIHGSYLKSPGTQPAQPSLSVTHLEGNVTWFTSGDRRFSPYLTGGAGVAYHHYDGAASSLHRLALGGGLGFRLTLGENISLRIEGRDLRYKILIPSTGREEYRNQPEAFAGFSFGIGGPPRDRDHDGVPDDDDRCAGTPKGARVDAVGCAIDSDEDGVFDGIDQCANTQPGTVVDARGCEVDRDLDGIPDRLDRCPATPKGAVVDASGCELDQDLDGIPNGLDRCPTTPKGAVVDARGCELDQDLDGIPNGLDRCPDTPKGVVVDARGCPRDSDQDGVYDGIDQCAMTPEGCVVNTNGCPTDSDQDGVCDGIDECPDSPARTNVDRSGCPVLVSAKETQLLETGMIRLQNVNFQTGRSKILRESEPILDEVGNILARWPDLRIEIGGHTDSQGSVAKNKQLSRDRAEAVLEYLMFKFPELKPSQFTTVGYGAWRPISSNATELGRAKNRRVEFKVLNKEALKKTEQRPLPRD